MNIGRTRYKPEPVRSPNYDELDRRIVMLQNKSNALYENDELSDEQLDRLVRPINEEIASLIEKLYL